MIHLVRLFLGFSIVSAVGLIGVLAWQAYEYYGTATLYAIPAGVLMYIIGKYAFDRLGEEGMDDD